jgi:hypothetical protein
MATRTLTDSLGSLVLSGGCGNSLVNATSTASAQAVLTTPEGGKRSLTVNAATPNACLMTDQWLPSQWVDGPSYNPGRIVLYNGTIYYNGGAATTAEPPAAPWVVYPATGGDLGAGGSVVIDQTLLTGAGAHTKTIFSTLTVSSPLESGTPGSVKLATGATLQASGTAALAANTTGPIAVPGLAATSVVVASYSDPAAHIVPLSMTKAANTLTITGDAAGDVDWFVAKF